MLETVSFSSSSRSHHLGMDHVSLPWKNVDRLLCCRHRLSLSICICLPLFYGRMCVCVVWESIRATDCCIKVAAPPSPDNVFHSKLSRQQWRMECGNCNKIIQDHRLFGQTWRNTIFINRFAAAFEQVNPSKSTSASSSYTMAVYWACVENKSELELSALNLLLLVWLALAPHKGPPQFTEKQ